VLVTAYGIAYPVELERLLVKRIEALESSA
jgi:hypothetical protein